MKMDNKRTEGCAGSLMIIWPECEYPERAQRLSEVLTPALERAASAGTDITVIRKTDELSGISLRSGRVIFAVSLSEAGVNMEYYRLLEYFRKYPECLQGSIGGIIVDGSSELFTKALARRLAFSANMAGCTFPGRPMVEATGSLGNFHVLSGVRNISPLEAYMQEVDALVRRVTGFEWPSPEERSAGCGDRLRVLALHAGSRKTSNSLLLWDKVRQTLEEKADITEISLRNGIVQDCRGCRYEDCLHFGENDGCFYGGIMTEQVYPAIIDCDAIVMICPNYNDAIGANLTAFINRLTALFRTHDFSRKRVYAVVVSGYSGGDIVAEQVIGSMCFNKSFILPERFALMETANDPGSIEEVEGIDEKAAGFARHIS